MNRDVTKANCRRFKVTIVEGGMNNRDNIKKALEGFIRTILTQECEQSAN